MNETYLIDTHSHVDMLEGMTPDEAIKNAKENGVEKIIVPCAAAGDIDKIYNLVNTYDELYGLLGVHPSEVKDWDDSLIQKISDYAKSLKIVGIGEIGLDYYWDKSFIDLQKDIFIKQIKLANTLNLPICVHDRDAHKDTFDILKAYNKCSTVVMHPVPFRGKQNQPAYVRFVAEEIAKLRGISFEELAGVTSENARKVFAL